MSSTYSKTHAAQGLIYAQQNKATAMPLVKLVNPHKEALISLLESSENHPPPGVPPRVPVRGAYQEKLQQFNQ